MKKLIFYSFLCLLAGHKLQAQIFYTINPYAGDLQSANLTLSSSFGDLVAGEIAGEDIKLVHLIIYAKDKRLNVESNQQIQILVYPNPVQDKLTIKVDPNKVSLVKFYNSSGKLIIQSNLHSQVFDLSGFNEGVYFLRLFNDSNQLIDSFKIIKY